MSDSPSAHLVKVEIIVHRDDLGRRVINRRNPTEHFHLQIRNCSKGEVHLWGEATQPGSEAVSFEWRDTAGNTGIAKKRLRDSIGIGSRLTVSLLTNA